MTEATLKWFFQLYFLLATFYFNLLLLACSLDFLKDSDIIYVRSKSTLRPSDTNAYRYKCRDSTMSTVLALHKEDLGLRAAMTNPQAQS